MPDTAPAHAAFPEPSPATEEAPASAPAAEALALESVTVTALGVPIAVDGLTAAEAAQFRTAWSRCLPAQPGPAVARVARIPGSFDRAGEALTSHITLAAIDELAGKLMMFHACGLADPDGSVTAFIAPSGTGKTTVARTLGPGRGYVSDETIAVDGQLRITPYPKPLSVKQAEPGVPKLQEGPEQHGLGPTPPRPVLRSIALLSRSKAGQDAAPASVEPVPLGVALLELTPQLSALARLDRGLVQLCTMIEACGGVQRIRYSEARDIAGLLPLISAPDAGSPAGWAPLATGPVPVGGPDAPAGGVPAVPGHIRRAAVQDAVEVDGTVYVLADSQVLELGPLGGVVWDLAGSWTGREELLAGVVDAVGPHPAAGELLEDALAELLRSGVLEAA